MPTKISAIKTSREVEKSLQALSPFEIKNELIALAQESAVKSSRAMLNAGRGNPNWIATIPREAFFLFGQFALAECRSVYEENGIIAGIVQEKTDIASRFEAFIAKNKEVPGAALLDGAYQYGVAKHNFDKDAWIREWVEALIGYNYPVPDRMLAHMEPIVHDYLVQEMCGAFNADDKFDLFAVEGGTAAMCYIFDSAMQNHLTKRGDKIALLTPT
ncbi:MAG: aspartate 4-decarboxylase, partial [Flavobacterium sp.]